MPSTLSPADWKKVVKENPEVAEADALTKALDVFDRAEGRDDPDALVDAIELVISKAESAKKKNKAKAVVGYLDKLIKEAQAERKAAEAKAREREEAEEDGDEEGGHEGALLKGQLKRVMKLKADNAKPFLVALGKVCGLVIPKGPTLSGEHKKRARAMRVGSGKLLQGRCHGEAGKVVFAFEVKPPGGLAKGLKKAILIHTELKARVLVRGPEGEFDDENDLDEMTDLGTDAEGPEAEGETPTGPTPGDAAAEFAAAARAVKDRLDALRASDAGRAAPLTTRYATALGSAQAGRYDDGLAVLKALDGEITAAGRAAASAPEPQGPAKAVSMVVLQQSRLAWEAALKKVRADADRLAAAIVDRFEGEDDLDHARATADRVRAALDVFDQELSDTLDKALNAETPEARAGWNREAAGLIADYLKGLDTEPVYALLDTNPYVPVTIHKTLSTTLKTLAGKLA